MIQLKISLVCLLILVACSPHAVCQESNPRKTNRAKTKVTRSDLGLAYMRLEQALANTPLTDAQQTIQFNQRFDSATVSFFVGQYPQAIKGINQLSIEVVAGDPSNALDLALSLQSTMNPPIVRLDTDKSVQIQLRSMYAVKLQDGTALRLSLQPLDGGARICEMPVELVPVGTQRIDMSVDVEKTSDLSAGVYAIELWNDDGVSVVVGRLKVVESSLDSIREQNNKRLDAVEAEREELRSAIAACRSRNALLSDAPPVGSTTHFLTDFNQLVSQLDQEIEKLTGGKDPYSRRAGDYWRTFRSKSGDAVIPSRVYAPEKAISDQPVPLVVALHGAGGDENMFFSAYGAGKIKKLADQHGFLVVAPATNSISRSPNRFDHLVSEISADYAIDPNRIYLIGHSMGGFATISLLDARPKVIAAACCLAGGGKPSTDTIPPTLIISGKLDSIVSFDRLERQASRAKDAGLPVEFREKRILGHTLMVGETLPEAVEWLLNYQREN